MCIGNCAHCMRDLMVCIIANTLLLVPNGKSEWTNHLSLHICFMAGFTGRSLVVTKLAREMGQGRITCSTVLYWSLCKNQSQCNVMLFSLLVAASGLEMVLYGVQLVNVAIGVFCGNCRKNRGQCGGGW
ncbi:transmembrane 4 L6 family member 5 [Orycteropus afer afer]|uniref:Transmembrane 4 L6 family member 5 n=1 Tax=Orycteropus afer afer TaxID=1230840 RepID=A0A8B7AW49_ORYAF|nr:transmembrane 4 L6 family member 5 [Orycteropus afer afer]